MAHLQPGALAFLIEHPDQARLRRRVVDAEHALYGVCNHLRIQMLHPIRQHEFRRPVQTFVVAQNECVVESALVAG